MADRKRAAAKREASAEATRDVHIANFEGDEINGRRYALGDEIADDVDAGTIAYLVANGRITKTSASDSPAPALGGKGDMTPQGEDKFDAAAFVDRDEAAITDDEIKALTPERREAVKAAENARPEPRPTLLGKLD